MLSDSANPFHSNSKSERKRLTYFPFEKTENQQKSPNASTSEARRCAAWRGLESTP